MTTGTNTSFNPAALGTPDAAPGAAGEPERQDLPAGLPDEAELARLANAMFRALPGDPLTEPGGGAPVGGLTGSKPQTTGQMQADPALLTQLAQSAPSASPRTLPALDIQSGNFDPNRTSTGATALSAVGSQRLPTPPGFGFEPVLAALPITGSGLPDEARLREVPAALAGLTGQSPHSAATAPEGTGVPFQFLHGAQPASPRTVPALDVQKSSFDPNRTTALPTAVSAPGSQRFPSPPGLDPAGSAMPSFAGSGVLDEARLRELPGTLAGLSGQPPHPAVRGPGENGSSFYFLRSPETTSPGAVPALNLEPAGFGPGRNSPGSSGLFSAESARLPSSSGVETLGIDPTSAYAVPGADELTELTSAALASLSGDAPRFIAPTPPASGDPGSSFYFLDGAETTSPRALPGFHGESSSLGGRTSPGAVQTLNLESPDLGGKTSPRAERGEPEGAPLGVPGSRAADSPGGRHGQTGEKAGDLPYFLRESHAAAGTLHVPRAEATERRHEREAKIRTSAHPGFDVQAVRRDFPILQEKVNGRPLIWLDNAATTQKPQAVIDRLAYFYSHENSNIHRGAHELAARATDAYEAARRSVARFLHAASPDEIVFVRGTTEGINLVAQSWGRRHVGPGDEIVITWLEHHANIVPWQQLAQEKGARLRVAPVDEHGQVLLDEYERLLGPRTRLVAFSQVSNALGTITPTREMVEIAHRYGARVLVDGAQSVSHMAVDVQALDCDWFVFSGHKVFGPTGIGAVYGKLDLLNAAPPWQGGGNMIQDVTFERTLYQSAPGRFEAGTGNIADAVGLAAALEYVERIGLETIRRYEHELLVYGTQGLQSIPGLRLIGTAPDKASVLSFVLEGFRSEDIGGALNQEGIAVRAGHHCAQPILRRFGLEATVRPSLAFYNTHEEIDTLVATLRRIQSGGYGLPH